MNKQLTLSQYRGIDLTILAVVLTFTQVLTVAAATIWFRDQLYIVSPVASVVTLALMRWGPWAGLHAALGGMVFCLASGAGVKHYIIYAVGNLLSLAALGYIKAATPEGIRQSPSKSLLLALAVTLLMQLGRALVAVVLGSAPAAALGFFTTDVITLLFTLVLIWIARRLDGIFEEQNHYLLRLKQQENEERGGY